MIARGGMGEVYRATDSVLGRTVAVKLLSERHSREPEARARFRREALAAARVSGARNVVTLFDVAEHDGRPLIVMEYVDGGSVHEAVRRGPVARELALEWLEQTAGALDRAHAEGVVHRDVKPANLLLDRDGNAHVSDFGIASTTGVDTVTLPGTVLGTVGYLSPEQARGEPATPASDRYALGVVAFELLTGRRPFASETATTEVLAHLHAPVPRRRRSRRTFRTRWTRLSPAPWRRILPRARPHASRSSMTCDVPLRPRGRRAPGRLLPLSPIPRPPPGASQSRAAGRGGALLLSSPLRWC